mmetsp:Transcript_34711/g.111347  ORF Transcript_34711/g.111347 Transcript_34711/m.111347 type:complete len:125 (+) Transcript_34711:477-851(+)
MGAEQCAVDLGLNWLDVDECARDPVVSKGLMIQLGHATAKFKQDGTPTFVVNDAIVDDSNDIQYDLFYAVCSAYEGIDKPKACDDYTKEPSRFGPPRSEPTVNNHDKGGDKAAVVVKKRRRRAI